MCIRDRTATDVNGNPIYLGLPVKAKNVDADFCTLTLDISNGALGTEGSTVRANINQLNTTNLTDLEGITDFTGARVGIRNTFSIAKGRIII